MTYAELYDMVDVADVDATQIMKITVTDTDAERAGEIVQTIADIVPDVLAKNLISTYAVIIKVNYELNEEIDSLDLDMTYGKLYKMVEVTSVDSTQIMQITVTDTDAERAGEIVQTIADIVPDVLVEKVGAGSCKTVSDVSINPNKVFPQTKKYVVMAGLLGAVLVCGVLVLAHLLHDTVVDDEDVQKKLGLPVLGLIPEV